MFVLNNKIRLYNKFNNVKRLIWNIQNDVLIDSKKYT